MLKRTITFFLIAFMIACLATDGSFAAAEQLAPIPQSAPWPNVEVVVDVGHGGIDGGTSYHSIMEKDVNLQVSKRLLKELQKRGIRSISNRAGDYALSDDNAWLQSSRHKKDLAQRSELANQLSPKLMVSLHCNWAAAKKKNGPLVIFQKNGRSRMLAHIVQSQLNTLYGSSTVPEIGKKFYVLNHTRSAAVIVEMGFLSNSRDRAMLTSEEGQQKIAAAIAESITEYLYVGDLY